MSQSFRHLLRVRYSECDAQQVVFNAIYAEYADIACTEFFREVWGGYESIIERGLDSQVVDLHISWQASARFDDVLAIEVECTHVGNTSFVLSMQIKKHLNGEAIAKCDVAYVMVDAKKFTKTPVPQDLRDALSNGAANAVSNHSGLQLS